MNKANKLNGNMCGANPLMTLMFSLLPEVTGSKSYISLLFSVDMKIQ